MAAAAFCAVVEVKWIASSQGGESWGVEAHSDDMVRAMPAGTRGR